MTATQRHPGHIAALPVTVAITSSCFFINLPLIPLFFQSFEGAPQILLGPTLAVSFALSALLGPFWGRLADKYGYRLMMQRASGLLVLTYVCTALAPNAEALFGARVLNGVASGFIPAATAYAIRATGEQKRNRVLTTLSAARNSGAVFGPALGALFAAWWGFRGAFLAASALSALALLVTFTLDRDVGEQVRPDRDGNKQRDRTSVPLAAAAAVTAVAVITAISSGLQVALPRTLSSHLGVGDAANWSGAIFAVAGMASLVVAYPWGKFADKRGVRPAIKLALLGSASAVIMMAAAEAPLALALLYLGFVCSAGELGTLNISRLATVVNSKNQAQALGWSHSATQVGASVGPLAAGSLPAIGPAFFIVCALALLSTIFFEPLVSRHQPKSG